MKRRLGIYGAVAIMAALACATARADDADVIAYRKHTMRTLDAQAGALGLILSSKIPDDNAVVHLETIAMAARAALTAFRPNVPGGESNPEIWRDWDDFAKRMTDFARKTDEAAKYARERGANAAYGKILDALDCKNCHYTYRIE